MKRFALLLVPILSASGCRDERCHSAVHPTPASFSGGFSELTSKLPPGALPDIPPDINRSPDFATTHGVIADVDEDGRSEVVLFVNGMAGPGITDHVQPQVFQVEAGMLVTPSHPLMESVVQVSGLVDIDGDGHLDLLSAETSKLVSWGIGGGRFSEPASVSGIPNAGFLSHLMFADIDSDGWLDVVLSASSTTPECSQRTRPQIFLRNGPRSFDPTAIEIPSSVAISDDNVMIMGQLAGNDVLGMLGDDTCGDVSDSFFAVNDPLSPNLLQHTRILPKPSDSLFADDNILSVPMGAVIGDLDGDGFNEVAVSGHSDVGLWRGANQATLQQVDGKTSGLVSVTGSKGEDQIPWTVAFLDLDRDERQDVVVTHGEDTSEAQDQYIGSEWTTAYWNTGEGLCLEDVTDMTGLRIDGEWRTMFVGDLEGDGDPDLIVGGSGRYPLVHRNDIQNGNHGLSVRLRGTTSNSQGIGAVVEVQTTPDASIRRFPVPGFFQVHLVSEPMVFIGLGPHETASLIRIRWPSGYVQELRDVPAGRQHTFVEPSLVTVSPGTRQLPADGAAEAAVVVTPRTLTGESDGTAQVELVVVSGDGVISQPAEHRDQEWVARVRAPSTPGKTRLEVRINGRPLSVRPVLFWQ